MANPNPFAIAVLAQVAAIRAQKDVGRLYNWKKHLVLMGYERGYSRETIVDLFVFIDWIIVLPVELEIKFEAELTTYEKERNMEYITCIERRGIDKGRQEGRQEGEKNALKGAIITTLEARFKEVPWELREQINQIEELGRLTALLRQAATCTAIDEFKGA